MPVARTSVLPIALGLLALWGHAALWIGVWSRVHALGVSRASMRLLDVLLLLSLLGPPAAVVWALADPSAAAAWAENRLVRSAAQVYFGVSAGMVIPTGLAWLGRRRRHPPRQFRECQRTVVDVAQRLGRLPCRGLWTRVLARIPRNQLLQLEINEKTLEVPRLPPGLDGLTIVHFSDLHFQGTITPAYFDFIVGQANAWEADLVAVTGDLLDSLDCLPWITTTLGRIASRCGAYCVLGNHDRDLYATDRIRQHLADAGWQHLGGRTQAVPVRGHAVVLAGTEHPWFRPPADPGRYPPTAKLRLWPKGSRNRQISGTSEMTVAGQNRQNSGEFCTAQLHSPPAARGPGPLRILLSHSPDQLAWARAHDFDVMLAGHTHGGQICLPLIGPLVANSRYGVKYASGVFFVDPTLLHVSRGVGGREPFRWNCRPELTKLVLRCPRRAG